MYVAATHDCGLASPAAPAKNLQWSLVFEKFSFIRIGLNVQCFLEEFDRILRNLNSSNLFPLTF
jgi:hypothetical protein